MPAAKLAAAITAVDWNKNAKDFLADIDTVDRMARCNLRLAVWARQFEIIDKNNPALSFIREMQIAGHHVAALAALGLYKPAAGAMRTMLETALYYSYFRMHSTELATLVRDRDFYVTKQELIEYHKRHTVRFSECQTKLGLLSRLTAWYGLVSSIVHGQIPGKWIDHSSLSEIAYIGSTLDVVAATFVDGEKIVNDFFLCTLAQQYWDFFSTPAKKVLVAHLPGDVKGVLGIDHA